MSLSHWASTLRNQWDANPYAIHKRAPFSAVSFDNDDRYWVVGSTMVSVLHGWHGPRNQAGEIAEALNAARPSPSPSDMR